MGVIIILQGPEAGRHFPMPHERATLGRNSDCVVSLSGKQFSRQHARIYYQDGQHFLEDLNSSNGTFVNGTRLTAHRPSPLGDRDTFQIGNYLLALRPEPPTMQEDQEPSVVVRETVSATSLYEKLFAQDPAAKLQVVLDIAQQLARTLELDPLLDKLLEQLMKLFPQADRVMAILCEGEKLVIRAQRTRPGKDMSSLSFSRTIVKRALDEGIGLISEDLQSDQRFQASNTILSLDLHSIICVPLIDQDGKRLGVLQVDRFCRGYGFRLEDLHMLTALSMQVVIVLENVRGARREAARGTQLMQELAMARDIQEGYLLPEELEGFPDADFERWWAGCIRRQDRRGFLRFRQDRLGPIGLLHRRRFGQGDAGGGTGMIAVRTLCRHLAKETVSPAVMLTKLNEELSDDNPKCMFVTLAHGVYHPPTGQVVMASAGHPAPILRRADGTVEVVAIKPGRLLGYSHGVLNFPEAQLVLHPGDTLLFYTDGFLEARAAHRPDGMFGVKRICEVVAGFTPDRPLGECTDAAKVALDAFTGTKELQDDLTLRLVLRRVCP